MEKIIDFFPEDWTNVELEFKVHSIDISHIKRLINNMVSENTTIERSINCIKSINKTHSKVYRVILGGTKEDGKKIDSYEKKLIHIIQDKCAKLKLSEENPITYSPNSCDILRFKNRISFPVLDWRLDITFIKTINHVQWSINILHEPVKQLLRIPGLTSENYTQKIPWNYIDSFELEMEYTGTSPPSIESINQAHTFINSNCIRKSEPRNDYEYNNILGQVAKKLQPKNAKHYFRGEWPIKRLLNSVVTLDIKSLYNEFLPNVENYTVSPKIDGVRTIVFFNEGRMFAIGKSVTEFDVEIENKNVSIFDAELFENENRNNDITLYLFDCMVYEGIKVLEKSYLERLSYIDQIVGRHKILKKKPIDILNNNWKKIVKSHISRRYIYDTDGLIFTPADKGYNSVVYKWKPLTHMSIDFLYKNDSLYLGVAKTWAQKFLPKNLYNSDKNYIPAKFSPTFSINRELWKKTFPGVSDGSLVELVWDFSSEDWKLLKVRMDRQKAIDSGKYFGNDYKIADKVWHSIHWPITPAMLVSTNIPKKYKCSENAALKSNFGYFHHIYNSVIEVVGLKYVIDIGAYMNTILSYAKYGIERVDFLIADGFSCLDIINDKYSHELMQDVKNKMMISAWKPSSYTDSGNKGCVISMFPTKKQLTIAKKLAKNKKYFILTSKKNLTGFDAKKITDEYPCDNFKGRGASCWFTTNIEL